MQYFSTYTYCAQAAPARRPRPPPAVVAMGWSWPPVVDAVVGLTGPLSSTTASATPPVRVTSSVTGLRADELDV